MDADVLVDAAGHVVHARQLTNRLGIGERHRRRRPEAGFEIAEALARRRMIVLLHRIVFRMERDLDDIVVEALERVPQRLPCVTLVRDRFVAVGHLGPPVAGPDRDLIEAGGAHLLFDRSLRAGANRHHRQHRRHADGDAEHGQAGLQAIAAERLEGDVDHGVRRRVFSLQGTPP